MIWPDIRRIRAEAPLVHNITNYVVMNPTANALLALGASPVMAHAVDEVEEMVRLARGLVLNIGTLSGPWIEAMLGRAGKPGAGASPSSSTRWAAEPRGSAPKRPGTCWPNCRRRSSGATRPR